jgi:caffeoyl-CoA O-methyltransferase
MPSSPIEKGFGQGSVPLARWAEELYQPEDPVLAEIRERSVREGLPPIAVGRFDGLHLEVLARATGARKVVEIGTLGGYSGMCLLRGMPAQSMLHTFELTEKNARVARETFERAGLDHRVQIHVGPALENLPKIEIEGPFDLVFIDADKVSYPKYLDWAEKHLKMGGIVLLDNAFGWGHVCEADYAGEELAGIQGLREMNERLAKGGRFRATMIPTEEGLAMGVKVR